MVIQRLNGPCEHVLRCVARQPRSKPPARAYYRRARSDSTHGQAWSASRNAERGTWHNPGCARDVGTARNWMLPRADKLATAARLSRQTGVRDGQGAMRRRPQQGKDSAEMRGARAARDSAALRVARGLRESIGRRIRQSVVRTSVTSTVCQPRRGSQADRSSRARAQVCAIARAGGTRPRAPVSLRVPHQCTARQRVDRTSASTAPRTADADTR